MRSHARAASWMMVLGLSLVGVAPSWAQTDDETALARRRFEEGSEAYRHRDYTEAIAAFEESYRLVRRPQTLFALARSYDFANYRVRAHALWEELVREHSHDVSPDWLREAQGRLRALEAALAVVTVASDPPGAALFVDDTAVAGEVPLVEPGEHRFVARLAGYQDAEAVLTLRAGANDPVLLRLQPVESAPPPDAGPHEAAADLGVEPETAGLQPDALQQLDAEPAGLPETTPSPEPRRPRGFWQGPWPWVIAAVALAGAGAVTAGVLLSPTDPEPEWRMRLR